MTEASGQRGNFTAEIDLIDVAVYAGSHPGFAQAKHWPMVDGEPWRPPEEEAEAFQMAIPLIRRLVAAGRQAEIPHRVRRQAHSSHSLGDMYHSIRLGHLDPIVFTKTV